MKGKDEQKERILEMRIRLAPDNSGKMVNQCSF
jgi:hypothetical protein